MNRVNWLILILAILLVACNNQKDLIVLIDLRTEHMNAPMGIDTNEPRFSWKIDADNPVENQSAYHIFVDTDSTSVANGKGAFWEANYDSDSTLITYHGKPLQPYTKYFWGVQVTCNNDRKSKVAISSFETGMMNPSNWQGNWITDVQDVDLKPAPYFRKEFKPQKKVEKARAYITTAGLHELYINGKKIGDHWLDPIYTRFDKRNLYVTYDITKEFQHEEIAIGVLLGNGWYNHQSTAVWNFHEAGWRARPRFCLNIRVFYTDGSTEVISTDKSWKTALSPVVFNSIYTAEHYDARLELPGWDQVDYEDSAWKTALETTPPSNLITAQVMPPITGEKIAFSTMDKRSERQYIFDLGRNISGVTELRIKGEKDTRVRVTHAEQLDSIGNLDLSNIIVHYRPKDSLDPFQTDVYTLK
ncbi:MAG: family 78 glycoside hydrolase catalytic domain, partial [Leptolyngbya sp. SIO1D8]|nr:family 78 glycoside hydrolase catalytic domain [Leptolyngbya sp. SIO1D8]